MIGGERGDGMRRRQYHTIEDPGDIDYGRHALIEASAGTGKTYTIEHLVLRLVRDEGVAIDRILVVTFTEKAAGELKERIRGKLTEEWAAQPDSSAPAFERLQNAIDGFDSAGIHTIHGFCHMVLSRYGFELGRPLKAEVVDDAPLIQSLLRQRMRRLWPAVFGEDLVELLEFSGFPEYDARLDESRWERRIRRVILSSAEVPRTIPPAPGSPEELLKNFRALRTATTAIFSEIAEALGPIDDEHPGASQFAANFALLNQKGPSRNRKLKQFIIPLLQTTIDLENRGVSPPVAALRYLEAARRADLDPDTGFRTLSEEHWTKAGDNIAGVCPTLPRLVQALERLRAIDFGEASQALSADTILGVADDLEKYKRARARVSFNDMLRLVRAALVPEGSALLEILREQFQYAIVDEFQDTDPVQWEIFRRLYLDAGARGKLYLVGDPKQAIYGFRGADVFAYFQARETIENLARDSRAALYRLATNFRSVPELVRVFNDLFATPAFFGAPDPGPLAKASGGGGDVAALAIGYTPALESRPELRKIQVAADESGRAALQLVRLDQAGSGRAAKRAYFRFLAREIHALIRGKKIRLGVSDAAARPLDFGDVCILLRTRSDAPLMEDALERLNIPHSFYKKTGLYQTREALELSLVLRAVEAPARLEAGYKAGLTRFFRLSPEEIDDLRRRDQSPDEQGEPAFRVKINAWSELAEARRWPAFFRSLLQSSLALLPADTAPGGEGAPEAQREAVIEPQYERAVTNYEQICDELAEHAVRENFDLTGVIEYLELLRDEATPVREEWDVHRQESEDARVRLMTIHTAKGLEFPIVCVAGGFTRRMAHLYETFEYHNDQNQRVHDLLLADEKRFRREEEAEERRLYYVALTRAAMKLYLPYYRPTDARSKHTAGPLARFVRDAIDAAYRDPEDARDRLRFLETEEAGDFFQSDARPAGPGTATLPAVDLERSRGDEDRAPGDSARDFDPRILFPEEPAHANRRRRDLLSYTALSHGRSSSDPAAERTVGDSVPEAENAFLETSRDREDAAGLAFEFSSAVEVPAPSLSPTIQELDRRMRGADAGTMLHDMLEQLDYPGVAGDAARLVLSDGNRRLIARHLRRNGLLAAAAPEASESGDVVSQTAASVEEEAVDFVGQLLRRVLLAPIAVSGENSGGDFFLGELAPEHRIHELEFYFHVPRLFESPPSRSPRTKPGEKADDEDPARAPRFQDGYVWGFIDLVFRVGGRYFLADWKSNLLNDYSPRGLAAAMQDRQYDLQYRIYTYALLGWLKDQIPDFDYERDFGGVYYFFLRGMDPATPGRGVYFARPSSAENSQLLEEIRNRASI